MPIYHSTCVQADAGSCVEWLVEGAEKPRRRRLQVSRAISLHHNPAEAVAGAAQRRVHHGRGRVLPLPGQQVVAGHLRRHHGAPRRLLLLCIVGPPFARSMGLSPHERVTMSLLTSKT